VCITLAPPREVALSNRGGRRLRKWEKARIDEMYSEGYHARSYSDLVIDNANLTAEQTVSAIQEFLRERLEAGD
jgi:hypothetical protein